ncbi:nucleolar protein NOP52 variant [Ophiocordyceps camponoti-floridani]|uniref:Nucleolar protein NOP52 variant n=1 Tax=Ophiocordyceps camponoti-floridani TaxID=2030778 RepID=A0A8H4VDS4_9HYPO|nr:nucleolar protein NOP52 variant [Ophiocordyceps camponoti-floridani]
MAATALPFIRNLASSNSKLRTQSISTLESYLSTRQTLPRDEAQKLWTGLFYALWMSDRARAQQHLADRIASLAPPDAGLESWYASFWEVISRQWSSIDALRLDKFLLLVRRLLAAQVRWAVRSGEFGLVAGVLKC